jgi:integrase
MGERGHTTGGTAARSGPGSSCRARPPGRRCTAPRYTAGQRILDATRELKAAPLLGHASISTTADVYTDWDVERLESSLRETFASEAGK